MLNIWEIQVASKSHLWRPQAGSLPSRASLAFGRKLECWLGQKKVIKPAIAWNGHVHAEHFRTWQRHAAAVVMLSKSWGMHMPIPKHEVQTVLFIESLHLSTACSCLSARSLGGVAPEGRTHGISQWWRAQPIWTSLLLRVEFMTTGHELQCRSNVGEWVYLLPNMSLGVSLVACWSLSLDWGSATAMSLIPQKWVGCSTAKRLMPQATRAVHEERPGSELMTYIYVYIYI